MLAYYDCVRAWHSTTNDLYIQSSNRRRSLGSTPHPSDPLEAPLFRIRGRFPNTSTAAGHSKRVGDAALVFLVETGGKWHYT